MKDYEYINLNAFGLSFCYQTQRDIKISVLGAYSKVSIAHNWWNLEMMIVEMGLA